MNIIYWTIFGLIVGTVTNFILPSTGGGFVSAILLGVAGAVLGGYLGENFFSVGVTGFNLPSFIVAVLGAMLVIFVARVVSS